MSKQDIRWIQRFNNYQKALAQLEQGVELASERDLSALEKEGVIQRFEYTQELAVNVIKDFYEEMDGEEIGTKREVFELAFDKGLIAKGIELLESIKSRNLTSHTYNEEVAEVIFMDIINKYYDAFEELKEALIIQKEKRNL